MTVAPTSSRGGLVLAQLAEGLIGDDHRRRMLMEYGNITRWGTPMQWGTPMFGNVTALVGLHVTGKYRDEKRDAHMLQACGMGSSHEGRVVA